MLRGSGVAMPSRVLNITRQRTVRGRKGPEVRQRVDITTEAGSLAAPAGHRGPAVRVARPDRELDWTAGTKVHRSSKERTRSRCNQKTDRTGR